MDQEDKTILVLEDDESSYKLISLVLNGYNVFRAKNIIEAINLLEKHEYFDLYILDVFIRGSKFNGLDLIKLVDKNSKILIYTALDINYIMEHKYNEYFYIQKPVKPAVFKRCINNILMQDSVKE